VHLELQLSVFAYRGMLKTKGAAMVTPFVKWIETSMSLTKVVLYDSRYIPRKLVPLLLSRFVGAIRSRASNGRCDPLVSVKLECLDIDAEDVIALIQDSRLKAFAMSNCTIRNGSFTTQEQAARHVCESFATASIGDLSLDLGDSEHYVCGALTSLQSNSTLETLKLGCFSDNVPAALVRSAFVELLGPSACPIYNLSLTGFGWKDDVFEEMARSICDSQRISSLSLHNYSLGRAFDGLRSIFSQDSHPVELHLSGRLEFPFAVDCLLSDLIGSSLGLCLLDVSGFMSRWDLRRGIFFYGVLRGIKSESCAVQRLLLDKFPDEQCLKFVKAIGSFGK
jgi:hypothetical protein